MLRVVVISIILAVLGVFYVVANPGDPGMRGFGWFLVLVGALIAGLFLYIWLRREYLAPEEDEGGQEAKESDGDGDGGQGRGDRRRRGRS